MKAIKFVILGFGLLGVLSFFLPYCKIGESSYSALNVFQGVSAAEGAVGAARSKLQDETTEGLDDESRASVNKSLSEVEEVLDTVKGFMIIFFAPAFLMAIIGGVAAARGKLERLGGAGVMVLGLLGLGINGIFLAAWGTAEVKASGGDAGIAQYLLTLTCAAGFVLGLLTLIKPDRGGKFA